MFLYYFTAVFAIFLNFTQHHILRDICTVMPMCVFVVQVHCLQCMLGLLEC